MKAFAQALADLHQLANDASIQEFPAAAIHLVQPWIAFDGAVLGMGQAAPDARSGLEIAEAYIHDRAPSILTDYAQVSASDPITRAFLGGLAAPLRCQCGDLYADPRRAALARFARQHDLRQLLIFGQVQTREAPARWLVMYRASGMPFSPADADCLHALWLHLSIALDVNRRRALERIASDDSGRALALVNAKGTILAADPRFGALLRQEWPDFMEISLPRAALDSVARGRCYRGRCIDILFAERFGAIVCSAGRASAYARLSPAENRVALLFSAGMSQKEVARSLGVSEHTVRAQLKSSYSKLGIHDKAALTRCVVLHS